MKKFLKKNYLFIGILLLGLFLRVYQARELFMYSHDQDLAGWFIRDVLENRHFRLVGQETSVQGIFIGPHFYYLLIPFYLIFNMDPIGGVYLVTIIAITTIASYYFVFSKVFNKNVGLLGALIFATSFYTVMVDREVVPTTPVMLWLIWYFYGVFLVLKGRQKLGFSLIGFLTGLIWSLNLGLALLFVIALIALFLSRKKISFKALVLGGIAFLISDFPLIAFETRHNFQQLRSITARLTETQGEFAGGLAKLDRVMQLVSKNISRLLWGPTLNLPERAALYVAVFIFLFLIIKKAITRKWIIILSLWLLVFPIFYSLNSINISEYYLNGMTVVWIAILAVFMSFLLSNKNYKTFGLSLLILFLFINVYRLFSINVNKSGYIQRKQLVLFIKSDSARNNYPCVSVSYITKPGFDLGYRYLFWLEKMHVNRPDSGSPVYTIVFPHSMIDRIDKSFGALGLVYPDYERYNEEDVKVSCSGENSNLTDPMFGFTQ